MLDSLLEMERAYHMLKAEQKEEENDGDVDTFDRFYKNLKCGISVLPNESEEFELIQKYATNTHGKTHNFQIDIKQVSVTINVCLLFRSSKLIVTVKRPPSRLILITVNCCGTVLV